MTETELLEGDYELTEFNRELLRLRSHARAIGHELGALGVPRGETRAILYALVDRGVVDAYDDLVSAPKSKP